MEMHVKANVCKHFQNSTSLRLCKLPEATTCWAKP